MFAKLTGQIDSISSNSLILDVNGVGYLVQASARTLGRIGNNGDKTSLLIETNVREDQISLFGFADSLEKEWFNLLCTVQGVGAKAALAVLAVIEPEDLPMIITAEDKAMISRADGVGKKIALRIVTELKDKAGKMMTDSVGATSIKIGASQGGSAQINKSAAVAANSDAVSALVNLGYGRAEAFSAVTSASRNLGEQNGDVQILIRESLKELSA